MRLDDLSMAVEPAFEDVSSGVESLCPPAWVNHLASSADSNRLGELRPSALACLRYLTDNELASVVRCQLRQRRLFVRASAPRPVGTAIRVRIQAPSLLDAIEVHGVVDKIITPHSAQSTGAHPGMSIRLDGLSDELLTKLEARAQAVAG